MAEIKYVEGTTRYGYSFHIDERVFDDYRTFELMAKIDNNPLAVTQLIDRLFPDKEEKKKLFNSVSADGFTPTEKVMNSLQDIMTQLQNTKAGKN